MGKPASAMKYDPVKGRYVFDGASESEEEPVKAPPKKKVAEPAEENAKEEPKPKEKPKEVQGASAFT